jgi:hypothetical protein
MNFSGFPFPENSRDWTTNENTHYIGMKLDLYNLNQNNF